MSNAKQVEYTTKLLSKIQEIFEEDEQFRNELEESNNATDFIHALANIVPASVYGNLTNQDISLIDFNHIANKLCFQNSNLVNP